MLKITLFLSHNFFWQPIFVATNYFILVFKSQTPFSIAKTIIEVENNKKYLNVSFFYNNKDNKKK